MLVENVYNEKKSNIADLKLLHLYELFETPLCQIDYVIWYQQRMCSIPMLTSYIL